MNKMIGPPVLALLRSNGESTENLHLAEPLSLGTAALSKVRWIQEIVTSNVLSHLSDAEKERNNFFRA